MNLQLKFGIVATVILLMLILIGPKLAPYTMDDYSHFKKVTTESGETQTLLPPFPASDENVIGTDTTGRDMLSILLRGARVTILFAVGVALLRLLLALPLAYFGAVYPRTVGWFVDKVSVASTTIPMVLTVFLLVSIYNFSYAFTNTQSLMLTGVVVVLVGLFQTTSLLQQKMESILRYPFMDGLRSIGAGKWTILRKHVVPHLTVHLGVLLVSEIAQTLWLATQLGVLYVFLGGTFPDPEGPSMRIPEEWAGKIGTMFRAFRAHPMAVLYPAMALSLAILAFNMLADGLRKHNEQKWGITGK